MAIIDKLNTSWASNEQSSAVFDVRAALQNLKNVADETKSTVDTITDGSVFTSVDSEIKSEGAALIVILNSLINALDNHSDFLNWKQPTK